MQRRRSERNLRFYNAREKMIEDEEKVKIASEEEFEKEWAAMDR
jgi:hypothetical protein